jgi:hypothetical protein
VSAEKVHTVVVRGAAGKQTTLELPQPGSVAEAALGGVQAALMRSVAAPALDALGAQHSWMRRDVGEAAAGSLARALVDTGKPRAAKRRRVTSGAAAGARAACTAVSLSVVGGRVCASVVSDTSALDCSSLTVRLPALLLQAGSSEQRPFPAQVLLRESVGSGSSTRERVRKLTGQAATVAQRLVDFLGVVPEDTQIRFGVLGGTQPLESNVQAGISVRRASAPGGCLVVAALSRLSRRAVDVLTIVRDITAAGASSHHAAGVCADS